MDKGIIFHKTGSERQEKYFWFDEDFMIPPIESFVSANDDFIGFDKLFEYKPLQGEKLNQFYRKLEELEDGIFKEAV